MNLTPAQLRGLKMLGELSTKAEPTGRFPGQDSVEKRETAKRKAQIREAALTQALQTESGLKRIAANMANPVRFKLDYKGIFRKFVIVEQMPDGVPLIWDKDLPLVPAVKVGKGGSPRIIEMRGKRVEVTAFEIAARVKVPYEELFTRRYRALDRAKDRQQNQAAQVLKSLANKLNYMLGQLRISQYSFA